MQRVVEVGTGGHRREAVCLPQRLQHVEQFALAEGAPVPVVRGVARARQFRGPGGQVCHAQRGGEVAGIVQFPPGEGRGDGGGRDDPRGAEPARGGRQEERRVRTPGERHQQGVPVPEFARQPVLRAGQVHFGCDARIHR